MSILQKLYEGGHITYHRTDSTNLSEFIQNEIKSHVLTKFGAKYSHMRNYKSKTKCAQEAHEAIRPTHIDVEQLSEEYESLDKKIYEIDKKTGLEGTHGMIIHNKNVSKLITNLKPMKQAFDVELTQLCHRDKLNAYVIYPHIVNQQWEKIPSEIAKENFQSSKLKPSDFNHE
jgi:DNA topoisomerase IA